MGRPPRLEHFAYTGCVKYFLTFCTHDRRRWFTQPSHVRLVLDQFLYTAGEQEIEILVYCFMPDHLHVLAAGISVRADLRLFAGRSKQRAAHRFRRSVGERLWQPGYYDRILRSEADAVAFTRYIVANPVRAGIVEQPAAYEFWGSQRHTREAVLAFIGNA
jgi:putative transposase